MSETPTFHRLRTRLRDLLRDASLRAAGNEAEVSSGRRVGRDLAG
ncbi:MAG: hypothetical protein QOH05_1214, partial [Acetobacteraceae bacterium]|nr:hypothetical protein [Acetobacteraceae bacterium]